jgi:TolB-like protein
MVKLMGDGALVEFASVVDAVECAVKIQRDVSEHNADTEQNNRIEFRIGINVGDIIIDEDDIYGDGVNLAARLEAEADPGGICISSDTYRQVLGKVNCDFEDIGERTLKNIVTPVRAYRWQRQKPPQDQKSNANPSATHSQDRPSIAVLPFDNMSGDPDQEFFSDGITEDLITDLSKLSGLFVVARNTAFSFKGQNVDVSEVGRKLGVAHVLEGSVRKAGNRVRINAQLIETATGGHVWAERYDGNMDDIFDVQDEIGEKIVAALQVRLTAGEAAAAQRHITENVEAYELYLNARAVFNRLDPEGMTETKRLLERAIAIDPNFAAAYAKLSIVFQHSWVFAFPGFEDCLDQMQHSAEKAVALDDTLGLVHAHLGWASVFVGNYDQAMVSLERAIELDPNFADTNILFAEASNYAGDPERGRELARRAMEIDPVVPAHYPLIEGHSLYLLRDYDAAINQFKYAISLAPGFPLPHLLLGIVYHELGRFEDAAAQFAALSETLPPHVLDEVVSRLPYRDEEPKIRMRDALDQASKPA